MFNAVYTGDILHSINSVCQGLGQNDDLDASCSSLSSNEDAAVDLVVKAPLDCNRLKNGVQKVIQTESDNIWREKISHYLMQGEFLKILVEEGTDVTWKSYLWGVPRGVAKFAMNACLNTLPTADNLKRWGKRVDAGCKICGSGKQTLCHVLSSCRISLDQGRYTWRHNSVLRTMIDFMKPSLRPNLKLFSDLFGHTAGNGNVFPPRIIVTAQKPDLVLIDENAKEIFIMELTCPWDLNVEKSHIYKEQRYASLVADLSLNFKVSLFCIEVSVRGQISKSNRNRLKSFLLLATGKKRVESVGFINNVSKAALLSSYSLFCARDVIHWTSQDELSLLI
jgi:hypothetical protein